MDHLREQVVINKKWYLYWKDQHHGPFSALEIYAWNRKTSNSSLAYVWSSELTNWVPIEKSPLFQDIQKFSAFYEKLSQEHDLPILWKDWSAKQNEGIHTKLMSSSPYVERPDVHWQQTGFDFSENGSRSVEFQDHKSKKNIYQKSNHTIKKILNYSSKSFLIIFFSIMIGLFLFLENIWTSYEQPGGISDQEFQELVEVRKAPQGSHSNKIAIALNKSNLLAPQFYLSSSLAENTLILLELRGVGPSMVGDFFYAQQIVLKNTNRIIEVPTLTLGNKNLAKGFYRVTAKYNNQVLGEKNYFLGGIQDEAYQNELKEYHQKLKVQFENELTEANQMIRTLEEQIGSLNGNYELFTVEEKNGSAHALTNWSRARQSWVAYQLQIESAIHKYREFIKLNRYFLNAAFAGIADLSTKLLEKHKEVEEFILSAKPEARLEISISLELTNLKNQIAKQKEYLMKLELKYQSSHELPWSEVL